MSAASPTVLDMESPVSASTESARLLRIRALSTELDAQRQFVTDRGKTQESKASFILVVVGLVASFSSTRFTGSPFWAIGLLPVVVALASAVMAVLVLWPRLLKVVDAESLVKTWIDNSKTQEELEDYLLESKKDEIKARDKKYKDVTPHLKWAFRLLLVSVTVLFIVEVVTGFILNPLGVTP